MSVVGIDFGNMNTIVAVARNRGIDVITNETSNRATPSLVSFGEKQRFLGEGAKTLEISNFKNTVGSLKRMLGRKYNDPEILTNEKLFLNVDLVPSEDNAISASVMFRGEQQQFTFTQLCAMFLAKVKEFTSKELGIPCGDCVISCPNWFTDCERRALLDASRIAGLNPLRIMNDSTAAALGYGITKTDLPDESEGQKPRLVCFVDVGHSSTQVTVGSFTKGKLVIMGTSSDRNLGGRDFDQALTEHFIKEFDAKYKMDIKSNPKAVFRLRAGAEKVKKLLSANMIAPFNVECLLNDKDVSAMVERADFEEMAQHLITRLEAPVKAALVNANVKVEDIDFVELIGGSTRIPKVKEGLAKFFGGDINGQNKLSITMNQDEAVARGCAFQCAILSPAFKVRDFHVQDIHNHPIELKWDAKQLPDPKKGEKPVTEMVAFAVHHPTPSSKMLTFNRLLRAKEMGKAGTTEFTFHAHYGNDDSLPPGTVREIGDFIIEGIKEYPSCQVMDGEKKLFSKATIKVIAELTGDCLVAFKGAHQIEEVEVPDEEDKKKTKTVLRKHPLTVKSKLCCCSEEQLNAYLAVEGELEANDKLVIDTAEKRNALEEYVYETRSKLNDAWADFEKEDVRAAFAKELDEMEDWLYGEGEEETKSAYIAKLVQLRVKGDLIQARYAEFEARPEAEKSFREYANNCLMDLNANVLNINYRTIDTTSSQQKNLSKP